jgi:predicted Zn finger-like uncharacterized protein
MTNIDIAGLPVKLSCNKCSSRILVTATDFGADQVALRCVRCRKHAGWLSPVSAEFLADIVHHFGKPAEPVEVRR